LPQKSSLWRRGRVQDRPCVRHPQNGLTSKFIRNAPVRQEHSRSMSRSIAEPPNIPGYALVLSEIFDSWSMPLLKKSRWTKELLSQLFLPWSPQDRNLYPNTRIPVINLKKMILTIPFLDRYFIGFAFLWNPPALGPCWFLNYPAYESPVLWYNILIKEGSWVF
jgi:hypothetical protein